MALLDDYERKARLTPGLFAVAPVSIVITALGFRQLPVFAVLGGLLTTAGGTYLLSVVVGNVGRAAEPALHKSWGGPPLTQLLRLREKADSVPQRAIWRAAIAQVTGVALLDEESERDDPELADATIDAAIGQVRYLGHADGLPAVRSENAQYGLERNLFGFRWWGRSIAFACLVVLGLALLARNEFAVKAVSTGMVVTGALFLFWILLPWPTRTCAAGFRYARQLLNAVATQARGNTDAAR